MSGYDGKNASSPRDTFDYVIVGAVMPSIIGGNTNATTIMIGEKGGDLVRAKRSGRPISHRTSEGAS